MIERNRIESTHKKSNKSDIKNKMVNVLKKSF
jgi:hypothetical protein